MNLQRYFISGAVFFLIITAHCFSQPWSALGKGTNSSRVNAIITDAAGNVYAGGDFFKAGDIVAEHIARWDGQQWSALGAGVDGQVLALKYFNGLLYAGGEFVTAGGQLVNCIATWDGSTWSGFGQGMMKTGAHTFTTSVRDIVVFKNDLYAAGVFDYADGKKANYIARWTGTTWEPVGTGISGSYINTMAVFNDELYAGGNFGAAGGVTARNIARWNGTSWAAVGEGFNGVVASLKVIGGALYAGGSFTASGTTDTKYISVWNGQNWMPLTGSPDKDVFSLEVWDNKLIAGGFFTKAGTTSANRIALYNGTTWSALGAGVDDLVKVVYLDSASNTLYAGGGFLKSGSVTVNHIAKMQLITGIEEKSDKIFAPSIFPQPASDEVTITFPDNSAGNSYIIIVRNVLGQVVQEMKTSTGNALHIPRGVLAPGMYFYSIKGSKGEVHRGTFIFQ